MTRSAVVLVADPGAASAVAVRTADPAAARTWLVPAATRTADEPAPEPVLDWAAMPELELGPGGVGSTPVWPHQDAS